MQVTRQPLGPKFYVEVISEFVDKKKTTKQDKVRRKLEDAKIVTPSSAKFISGIKYFK